MIEFTDVVKAYEQGNTALNGVTMQIEDGEFCFLVGPSGSGKSTIIKLITGELRPTSGSSVPESGRSGSVFPMCWSWSAWKTRQTAIPTRCPAVSSRDWPSPVPW